MESAKKSRRAPRLSHLLQKNPSKFSVRVEFQDWILFTYRPRLHDIFKAIYNLPGTLQKSWQVLQSYLMLLSLLCSKLKFDEVFMCNGCASHFSWIPESVPTYPQLPSVWPHKKGFTLGSDAIALRVKKSMVKIDDKSNIVIIIIIILHVSGVLADIMSQCPHWTPEWKQDPPQDY
jgi:hypothetical protein